MTPKVERIIFLGEAETGKTQLANRLIFYTFQNKYEPTVGTNKDIFLSDIQNKDIYLHAYDVAGQARFRLDYTSDLNQCDEVFLVFDRTNIASLNELQTYYDKVYQQNPNLHIVLVETCIDKEKSGNSIDDATIEAFKEKNNIKFSFKVSSATNEGIDELRAHIIKRAKSSNNIHILKLINWIDINLINISSKSRFAINNIINILKDAERIKDLEKRKQYYLKNEPTLTANLNTLQKTSNLKTFQNVISTIFACVACLALVGFIPLYLNNKYHGNPFLFWTNGDKQQAELAINLTKKSIETSKPDDSNFMESLKKLS